MTLAFNEKVQTVGLNQKAKPNCMFTRDKLWNAKTEMRWKCKGWDSQQWWQRFKTKIPEEKRNHFVKIKLSTDQGDTAILNVYIPNRASKCVKLKWTEFMGKRETNIIVFGKFITLLLIIDRLDTLHPPNNCVKTEKVSATPPTTSKYYSVTVDILSNSTWSTHLGMPHPR